MQRDTTRCSATRADGNPCSSVVVLPSGYCHMHDPDRQAQLAGMRRAGGRAKGNAARAHKQVPASLRPVLAKLIAALDGVEQGSISPQQGSALAALAGAIVRVYSMGTLEERLAALEAVAEQRAPLRGA